MWSQNFLESGVLYPYVILQGYYRCKLYVSVYTYVLFCLLSGLFVVRLCTIKLLFYSVPMSWAEIDEQKVICVDWCYGREKRQGHSSSRDIKLHNKVLVYDVAYCRCIFWTCVNPCLWKEAYRVNQTFVECLYSHMFIITNGYLSQHCYFFTGVTKSKVLLLFCLPCNAFKKPHYSIYRWNQNTIEWQ